MKALVRWILILPFFGFAGAKADNGTAIAILTQQISILNRIAADDCTDQNRSELEAHQRLALQYSTLLSQDPSASAAMPAGSDAGTIAGYTISACGDSGPAPTNIPSSPNNAAPTTTADNSAVANGGQSGAGATQ